MRKESVEKDETNADTQTQTEKTEDIFNGEIKRQMYGKIWDVVKESDENTRTNKQNIARK